MHRLELTSPGGNDKKECGLNYVMIAAMRFFIKCFLTKQKYNHMEGATQILPVIDIPTLQEKANEFAMKGAIETLKEFYSGYNSPYRKALEESLKTKAIDGMIDIPDILGILNDGISQQVDIIANTAIAETYLPLVKRFLTRAEPEAKLSDILKEFIRYTGFEYRNEYKPSHYEFEVESDDGYFMYINISNNSTSFRLAFSLKSKKEDPKKVYELFTLPRHNHKKEITSHYNQTMELSFGGATLKMPFTKGVLDDDFISYIARMVIAKTQVTIDVDDFEEDLFPDRHCHC